MSSIQYAIEGSVQTGVPDWSGVPVSYWNQVSAVCRTLKDCSDLVYWFGNRADFCPLQPVLLLIPGVHPPPIVCGMGYATAAELRDVCVGVWGEKLALMEKKGSLFDFDDLRERNGLPERSKVAELTQYAFWDRVTRHKAAIRTDPFRQHRYPNPLNKVKFVAPDNSGWKGN